MIVTRFAPSPTGDLHLGGVWTALASSAFARERGGKMLLRVEDIDPPRIVPGSVERILDDLAWLGLSGDAAPVFQSARTAIYEGALRRLGAAGYTYPCDCSRAEIARIASAPHAGEETRETIYPGTCRDAPPDRPFKRPPSLRFRVPHGRTVVFRDAIHGVIEEDVAATTGDFVLRRADGVFSYQLVVAVDDAAMGITDVLRADDLLGSTARQVLLMELLGHGTAPTYAHLPLVVAPDGTRLAKRTKGVTVRELREKGVSARTILDNLAVGLFGTVPPPLPPPSQWRRTPWPVPSSLTG